MIRQLPIWIALFITALFLSSATPVYNTHSGPTGPDSERATTQATVFVKVPNFDVIDEKQETIFTIILEAPTPLEYEGTLLQLKSDDLSDVTFAAKNLAINTLHLYHEDAQIARQLAAQGFSVVLSE